MVRATVREWDGGEGWGVLDSVETPGGCWTHYSVIQSAILRADGVARVSAYKSLVVGESVELEWETPGQDGFAYRAVSVRRAG